MGATLTSVGLWSSGEPVSSHSGNRPSAPSSLRQALDAGVVSSSTTHAAHCTGNICRKRLVTADPRPSRPSTFLLEIDCARAECTGRYSQASSQARVQAAIEGIASPPAATDTSAASMAGSPRACRNTQPEAKTATPAPATLSRATSRRMSASSANIWWRRIE